MATVTDPIRSTTGITAETTPSTGESDTPCSSAGSVEAGMPMSKPPVDGAGSNWNPAQTRVFDVYVENGAPQTSQLLDIFACEQKSGKKHQREASGDLRQDVELQNSGYGRSSQAFSGDSLEKLKTKRFKLGARESILPLSLPTVKAEPGATPLSAEGSTPNGNRFSTHNFASEQMAFAQTDKWPTQMETAFLAALRLIIKNGTSKFKIQDKNYGRNELISLFVQYHTGEVRTKKQISSHIQVWKKSISNKITSNFKINELDQEILQLIEDGAIQSNESMKRFYSTFEEIILVLSKREESNMSNSPTDRPSQYPYLTPATSATSCGKIKQYIPTNGMSPQPLPETQLRAPSPATPLDYAKSIYGNLKRYKCVPVKVQEMGMLPPGVKSQQHAHLGPSRNEMTTSVLQSAKDLELQQRQLIENLSHTQNPVKLPPVSPDLYVRNMQVPYQQQQPMYAPPSQGLASGPLPHYPGANHRYQHNLDHVPAGMVPHSHAYYQQPQVYVPISAPHGPPSNNFQFARMPVNELQQPRMQISTPSSSSSSSSPNGGPTFRERGTGQVNGTKQ